jgi:hypothetical protein
MRAELLLLIDLGKPNTQQGGQSLTPMIWFATWEQNDAAVFPALMVTDIDAGRT